MPWGLDVDEVSDELLELGRHLALCLGSLGGLGNLDAGLGVYLVELLGCQWLALVEKVVTDTARAVTVRVVGQLVVDGVNGLVLGAGHIDATLDELANLGSTEHVVNPCVTGDVPLLVVAVTKAGSMLTDDMADLMAQQEDKLADSFVGDEVGVVVNLPTLVDSSCLDIGAWNHLALHEDGGEEGVAKRNLYASLVEVGDCHVSCSCKFRCGLRYWTAASVLHAPVLLW